MKHERSFMVLSFITGLLMLSAMFAPVSVSKNPVEEIKGTPPGWSEDINLSNNETAWDQDHAICSWSDNIHVVWQHEFEDFVYSKSVDGGKTWSACKSLYHNSAGSLFLSDIDVNDTNIHVVMSDHQGWDGIYYRNSTDNGEVWNSIKRISPDGVDASNPSVFVNNSNVHIIWHDFRVGVNGQIFYRRSLDGGITFDNGQGVDDDRQITNSPSVIGAVNMDADGSNISVVWYDERTGIFEIFWMISKDNGFTWEDGLGNVGQDRQLTTIGGGEPAIAVEGSSIHIAWCKEIFPGPVSYVYYINSTDNGATWSSPVLLSGPNAASYAANIAVSGDDVWVMWNDNRDGSHEVFFKNSTDGGISWGSDTRLTEMDGFLSGAPKISYDTTVHVAFIDERDGPTQEIYYKRYPDFLDLSPPSHSNELPPPDSYRDAPGTNISVHVTDPSGVNQSTIQLWINGSLVTHTSSPITDGFNVSFISPGFDPGVVECRIVADDNCSNTLDYTWNFTVLALYEIQLQEGWNLISVPHVQVDTAINEVLRDIDGKWNYIQWYDASDPSNHWKTNATFKPQQLNDLFYLNRSMAFWINITEPNVNLTVRGHISTYTEIPLYAGWNLVGYSAQTTETVANALWGTGADRVEVFNATAPYRIREVGPSYVMKPGEGYWVHVAADSVWVVDW